MGSLRLTLWKICPGGDPLGPLTGDGATPPFQSPNVKVRIASLRPSELRMPSLGSPMKALHGNGNRLELPNSGPTTRSMLRVLLRAALAACLPPCHPAQNTTCQPLKARHPDRGCHLTYPPCSLRLWLLPRFPKISVRAAVLGPQILCVCWRPPAPFDWLKKLPCLRAGPW